MRGSRSFLGLAPRTRPDVEPLRPQPTGILPATSIGQTTRLLGCASSTAAWRASLFPSLPSRSVPPDAASPWQLLPLPLQRGRQDERDGVPARVPHARRRPVRALVQPHRQRRGHDRSVPFPPSSPRTLERSLTLAHPHRVELPRRAGPNSGRGERPARRPLLQ